ncbi:hypothetical protein B0H14DRAFT_3514733 [Mycena olivaceomarginata]|nr:hypothetical protein B0H14DRAFT_3514733 [Mycena olivaceomarginata]
MGEYKLPSLQTSEQLKHDKHAEAQCRYREKNLETTREKARQPYDPDLPALRNKWQRLLRNVMLATPTIVNRKPFSLIESNRNRKFVAKFGEDAFFDFYLPQHKLRGADFLPGLAREYAQQLEEHDRPAEKGGMKGGQPYGKHVEKGGKKGKHNKEAGILSKI